MNGQVAHDGSGYETEQDLGKESAQVRNIEEIQHAYQASGDHHRDGHEKREARSGRSVEVARHTAGYGGAGAGYPREDGHSLEKPDPQRIEPFQVVQLAAAAAEEFGQQQHRGGAHQEPGGHARAVEGGFNFVLEQQSGQPGWNGGQNEIPAHARVGILKGFAFCQSAEKGFEDSPQVLPEIYNDRQQGAELNEHIKGEYLALGDVPLEQEGNQHQVSGGGHGQELGETLDNTQDEGLKKTHDFS